VRDVPVRVAKVVHTFLSLSPPGRCFDIGTIGDPSDNAWALHCKDTRALAPGPSPRT
jgi:hypothetical protein